MNLEEARKLLGVRSTTPLDRITRAYRRRVFAVHPDRNPADKDATGKVRRLTEAWEVAKSHVGVPLGSIFARQPVPTYQSQSASRTVFDDLLDEMMRAAKSPRAQTTLDDMIARASATMKEKSARGEPIDGLSALTILALGLAKTMLSRY